MSKYHWTSATSRLLRILRASRAAKEKAGWSRHLGAGFIKEDIYDVILVGRGIIAVGIGTSERYVHWLYLHPREINLRENDELIKYLEDEDGRTS